MERGYFKGWRKIKDSQSYNRSAIHRAILLTLFVDANWKGGFFCGRAVAPGQIATSIKSLAEELREPRTNVMRALRDLEKDGVINLENVGNKWTMITLVNWSTYQAQDGKSGQPAVNQRSTSGQPVDTIKEGKKERKKEERQENTPQPPQGELATVPSSFDRFWAAYPNKVGKDAARKAWDKAKGKPKIDDLLAILDRQKTWPKWRNENGRYIPNPSTWLNQGRWNDEPPQLGMSAGCGSDADDMEAAMERVRQRNERLKAAERGEVA